jgi:membrane protease YdiL (CAAX protease family)
MPWDFALILVVLGVVVPWRSAARFRSLLARERIDTMDRLVLYATTIAFQWLAVAVVVWRVLARGLDAASLRIAIPDAELVSASAAGLSLLVAANQWYSLKRLARLPAARRGMMGRIATRLMPQNTVERLAFLGLVVTVALCEEILYRGFVLSVVERALDSSLAGLLGSSMLFGLAHLYQGGRGMRTTTFVGVVFGGATLWTGSILPAIAAHLVADLVVGLGAPVVLAKPSAPQDSERY